MAISWKAASSWRPGGGDLEMDQRPVLESEVAGGFWLEEDRTGELLGEGTHLVGHRLAGITAKVSGHMR